MLLSVGCISVESDSCAATLEYNSTYILEDPELSSQINDLTCESSNVTDIGAFVDDLPCLMKYPLCEYDEGIEPCWETCECK